MAKYLPYIPNSFSDLRDKMTVLLLCSPTFVDQAGYYPGTLETTFYAFNEGLRRLRPQLGETLFHKLMTMSDQMRAYFEADPEETTGETRKGKNLVYEMEALVEARWAEVRAQQKRSRSRPGASGK